MPISHTQGSQNSYLFLTDMDITEHARHKTKETDEHSDCHNCTEEEVNDCVDHHKGLIVVCAPAREELVPRKMLASKPAYMVLDSFLDIG